MKIGFDARIMAHPRCGISSYLENLIRQFSKINGIEIFLFGDRPIHNQYLQSVKDARIIIFGQRKRKYWSQFLLPGQLKKSKIDIYHAVWNGAVPFMTLCPVVVTIHDLIPLVLPGHFRKKRKKIKFLLQSIIAARRAKIIITDSQNTKNDIIKILKVSIKKIRVIYLGVEQGLDFKKEKSIAQIEECLRRFEIPEDYIINTGGFEHPRRNVDFLVRAFRIFLDKNNVKTKLVIVGEIQQDNPNYLRLKNEIERLNLEKDIIFTDRVSDFDMSILLSKAKLMVFPSLYEGFGIPPLEAMFCNTPVITTRVGSIPEIVDDAGILVKPNNENKLAEEISRLYFEVDLQERLKRKGTERIKNFSWERCADKTLEVYKEVLRK